jgi:hypothetical protein
VVERIIDEFWADLDTNDFIGQTELTAILQNWGLITVVTNENS